MYSQTTWSHLRERSYERSEDLQELNLFWGKWCREGSRKQTEEVAGFRISASRRHTEEMNQ